MSFTTTRSSIPSSAPVRSASLSTISTATISTMAARVSSAAVSRAVDHQWPADRLSPDTQGHAALGQWLEEGGGRELPLDGNALQPWRRDEPPGQLPRPDRKSTRLNSSH